jgi:hypothetical protein
VKLDDIFPLPLVEDGRIVKGVNTTPDVGPDEIARQAAKFGFSVSKDGIPVRLFTVAAPEDLIASKD